jgi:uncharacterized membrane protein
MTKRWFLTLLLLLSHPAWASAEVLYQIVDLGMGFAGIPQDINASGQTTGHHGLAPALGTTAVTWNTAGGRTILPTLGGADAYTMGLNDTGVIVGASKTPTSGANYLATIWQAGLPAALPSGGTAFSEATAINNKNQVVGHVGNQAALWDSGVLTTLGPANSFARAINDSGVIAGRIGNNAVVWVGGVAMPLNGLGGNVHDAFSINELGQVVGTGRFPGMQDTAVVWNGDTPTPLATLPGQFSSRANDINNLGQVVGTITLGGTLTEVPVIWTPDGPLDLNSVVNLLSNDHNAGMILTQALGINDAGMITVLGRTPAPFAATRPYLLVPVASQAIPEPSTFALLGTGALVLVWRIRRRCT